MRARRALLRCACVALLGAAAGCTAATSTQTVSGKTLYLYVSAPASAAGSPEEQDVLYAEELAFCQRFSVTTCKGGQLQGSLNGFTIILNPVVASKLSDNARTAIKNSSAIAYLGEVVPGTSANSIGITNAQDVLQVSPTDTAAELTQSTPAVKDAPTKYYENLTAYSRTFARVVPTTAVEAQDVIKQMQALKVKRLYVTGDNSEYGRTIGQAVTADASPSIVVTQSPTGADAVFYAGSSPSGAVSTLNQAASTNPKAKLFVPSALADQAFVSQLSAAAQHNLTVSSPGFVPGAQSSEAKKFVASFRRAYGHVPGTQAIFGYAAMNAVIDVLAQSGSAANSRSGMVRRFLAISNLPSVLGPLSINGKGDTNIAAIVFSRVKAGRLVPFKAA